MLIFKKLLLSLHCKTYNNSTKIYKKLQYLYLFGYKMY